MCIITTYVSQAAHWRGRRGRRGWGEYLLNYLGYKFSWFVRGVLLALLNPAARQTRTIPAGYFISPVYAVVGYPNRDSMPFGMVLRRRWCLGGR
jgi:Saccharopine dehydrogenase C-terminal domain